MVGTRLGRVTAGFFFFCLGDECFARESDREGVCYAKLQIAERTRRISTTGQRNFIKADNGQAGLIKWSKRPTAVLE